MPPVVAFVAGIGAVAASLFGIGLIGIPAIIAGSAVLALTVAAARRSAKLDDPSDAGYVTGQQVSVRSTVMPRNIAYGESNVGGVFTYVNTTGSELRELYYELVHTGHEIDSYSGWWLDDKYVPAADVDVAGDGSVDTNTGGHGLDDVSAGPVLYLRGALGTDSQAVDSMLDSAFTDIGTNHRHRGCARTVIRCDLLTGFESKWNGRAPQTISAVIKGKKVYDPRLDTTFPGGSGAHRLATPSTWAWSDNPALIWADYRITAKPLGPGWDSSRISYQSVFDAANACDVAAAIPTATNEKRFRCDLVVDTSMEPQEVIAQILASMFGNERQFGGTWHVYAGVWPTPDFALDESDLVGPIQYRKEPETSDRYNQIKGEFFDRDRQWKLSPFVTVNNTTLRTNRDATDILPKHLRLDGVSREYQAQRLALRALNQADDSGLLVFSAGYSAANIRVGDTGTVTISEFGWSSKSFRCVGVKAIDFLGYELKLKEDASGNYADPAEGEYSTRTAAGTIVFGTVLPWYLQGQPASGMWTPNLVNLTRTGSTYTKTGGTDSVFDSSIYSSEGFSRALITFKASQTDKNVDVGFNTSPGAAHDRSTIDYAIVHGSDGNVYYNESGTVASLSVSYAVTDLLALVYDGTFMRYYKNQTLLRAVAVSTPDTIYFLDSTFYETGAGIYELTFAPIGNVGTYQIDQEAVDAPAFYSDAGPVSDSVISDTVFLDVAIVTVTIDETTDVIDFTASMTLLISPGAASIWELTLAAGYDDNPAGSFITQIGEDFFFDGTGSGDVRTDIAITGQVSGLSPDDYDIVIRAFIVEVGAVNAVDVDFSSINVAVTKMKR